MVFIDSAKAGLSGLADLVLVKTGQTLALARPTLVINGVGTTWSDHSDDE